MRQREEVGNNIVDITAAPSHQRRVAQQRQQREAEVQEAMRQYYIDNPNIETTKKLATAAALGLRVIQGEKQ